MFAMFLFLAPVSAQAGEEALLPAVEEETVLYQFTNPNNGAGPLWCKGSTCIVRYEPDVFASGLETLPERKPLNNVRWTLYRRQAKGWSLVARDETGRTREPCPLGVAQDGRILLSVNPTLTPPDTYSGPAQPQVLEFSAKDPAAPPKTLLPAWEGEPNFTEHSYRGMAVDRVSGEILLLNIQQHDAQFWSYRDKQGEWSAKGKLVFPMGTDYEKPEPIRLCYPVVALRDRAAWVFAVSDIIEPVSAWREYKRQLTGQEWDYDFRRLFFTWTPDIAKTPFSPWVELANREKTCGWMDPLDIWIGPTGEAHFLWSERSLDPRLREKFFPTEKLTYSLEHAVIKEGKAILRETLVKGGEGESGEIPGGARLHADPYQRLYMIYYVSGTDAGGKAVSENRVMQLFSGGGHSAPKRVPLEHPLSSFFTSTERGGSRPSRTIDMLGMTPGEDNIMRYARVRVW